MNVIKCDSGHFYDSDKYDRCPHCGAAASTGNAPMSRRIEERNEQLRRRIEEQENGVFTESPTLDTPITAGDFDIPIEKTDVMVTEILSKEESAAGKNEEMTERRAAPVPAVSALQQELKAASASSEDRTIGYFSRMYADTASSGQRLEEPVTGWLVCIGGPHIGTGFAVAAGNNSIGRSADNKVVLSKDLSVSGHRHAVVVYEPKQRRFYLQPGESSGLTYLNETFIMTIRELKKGDVIDLGNTKLLFVPLCGPDFSWETYLQ